MTVEFNPPPNWPPPPPGWVPPTDWQPDPSWPAPPTGWQLWIGQPHHWLGQPQTPEDSTPGRSPEAPPVTRAASLTSQAATHSGSSPGAAMWTPSTELAAAGSLEVLCLQCGAGLRPGAKFCSRCAKPIHPDPEPASGLTAVAPVGGAEVSTCLQCGAGLRSGAKFCSHCAIPVHPRRETTPTGTPTNPLVSYLAEPVRAALADDLTNLGTESVRSERPATPTDARSEPARQAYSTSLPASGEEPRELATEPGEHLALLTAPGEEHPATQAAEVGDPLSHPARLTYRPAISDQKIHEALTDTEHDSVSKANLARAKTAARLEYLKYAGMSLASTVGLVAMAYAVPHITTYRPIVAMVEMVVIIGAVVFPVLTVGLLVLAIRPRFATGNRDPLKVMGRFLSRLVWEIEAAEAYPALAPATMRGVTMPAIRDAWLAAREELKAGICIDSATCARCAATSSNGLWSTNSWKPSEHFAVDNWTFIRCDECLTVYNKECRKGSCPSCGSNGSSHVFQSCEALTLMPQGLEVTEVGRSHEDRVAILHATVTTQAQLRDPYPTTVQGKSRSDYQTTSRGKIVCDFYNSAVKIGEKWYLVSALPC